MFNPLCRHRCPRTDVPPLTYEGVYDNLARLNYKALTCESAALCLRSWGTGQSGFSYDDAWAIFFFLFV
jgi:hypothetical protein